jgi:hypothetical protein
VAILGVALAAYVYYRRISYGESLVAAAAAWCCCTVGPLLAVFVVYWGVIGKGDQPPRES